MSVNKINKKEIDQYVNELVEILMGIRNNKNLYKEFLKDLLTPQEYADTAIRWQIIKMLAQGVSHRGIAQKLHVGLATITRGSRELQDKNGAFYQLVRQPKIK